jgi:peptidoglycan-associated lipoprotein
MHKKLHVALILFLTTTLLIFLPACSKNGTETDVSEVSVQEEDMEAKEVREQLERERQEREARERELRAEKIKFMYEDVYFNKGSYKLMPEARELLQRKALWLQKNPDIKVVVEGHTDEAGSKEYNFALGDKRAGAVKSFLIGQGIESSRLIAVSFGNEQPIDKNNTDKARSKNRRVHFVVEE